MNAQYWLILSAAVLGGFVLFKKADSASYEKLSKSAAQAFGAAQSFAAKLKKDGRKNVKVVRVEGGPSGFPKAYMVSFGDPQKPSFQTFAAVYS